MKRQPTMDGLPFALEIVRPEAEASARIDELRELRAARYGDLYRGHAPDESLDPLATHLIVVDRATRSIVSSNRMFVRSEMETHRAHWPPVDLSAPRDACDRAGRLARWADGQDPVYFGGWWMHGMLPRDLAAASHAFFVGLVRLAAGRPAVTTGMRAVQTDRTCRRLGFTPFPTEQCARFQHPELGGAEAVLFVLERFSEEALGYAESPEGLSLWNDRVASPPPPESTC